RAEDAQGVEPFDELREDAQRPPGVGVVDHLVEGVSVQQGPVGEWLGPRDEGATGATTFAHRGTSLIVAMASGPAGSGSGGLAFRLGAGFGPPGGGGLGDRLGDGLAVSPGPVDVGG